MNMKYHFNISIKPTKTNALHFLLHRLSAHTFTVNSKTVFRKPHLKRNQSSRLGFRSPFDGLLLCNASLRRHGRRVTSTKHTMPHSVWYKRPNFLSEPYFTICPLHIHLNYWWPGEWIPFHLFVVLTRCAAYNDIVNHIYRTGTITAIEVSAQWNLAHNRTCSWSFNSVAA